MSLLLAMKNLLITFSSIALFFTLGIKKSHSIECNSPVWRSTSQCIRQQKKRNYSPVRELKEDLGAADILGAFIGETVNYEAKCGLNANRCKVSFVEGRLLINNGKGIKFDQFINVVKTRTYREKANILSFLNRYLKFNYDYDYLITYIDGGGRKRSALIAFNAEDFIASELAHQKFFRDLYLWKEGLPQMLNKAK